MDIKWGNKPLKVCPFKIDVHSPVYPEKVGVTGPNLKTGVIGKDLDLKIDPRDAGHGMQFSYTYFLSFIMQMKLLLHCCGFCLF